MKSANFFNQSTFSQTRRFNPIQSSTAGTLLRLAACLAIVGLIVGSFYLTSSASSFINVASETKSTVSNREPAKLNNDVSSLIASKSSQLDPWSLKSLALPQFAPPSVATFAGDCSTPKTLFNVQDADKTVCAKVQNAIPGWQVIWSNARLIAVLTTSLTSGTEDVTFLLSTTSNLGDWRVILYDPAGDTVQSVPVFTVIDAANPTADVAISKSSLANTISAGSQAVFGVEVRNLGPSDATTVEITDSIPANTTFASFAPISAPMGTNCITPEAGSMSGDVICTIPTLARGEVATFLAAYDVGAGVPAGTVITNTASVSTAITDPTVGNPTNNDSSTASLTVVGATAEVCTLDCPANVVVTANTTSGGQPGAFVSFGAASVEGNCGTVTNSPPSGSFFTVGTHSIVSTAQFGGSCTFTVTVLDTNPPTITCPANITVTAAENATEANVSVGIPTINASGGGTVTAVRSDDTPAVFDDNGNVVTPAVVHAVTDPYPIGSTGITWTVTDAGGRTASCTQIVTVVAFGDRDPVTISCPAHVTVTASSGCSTTISAATIGTPTTVPSDSNIHVVARRSDDLPLSDPFPAGITTITWTAVDQPDFPDGTILSTASCVQNVTVNPAGGADTTPPILDVPDNVFATTASCTLLLDDELGVATAEDTGNCSGSNVNITRTGVPPNFIFPTGTTTITYTATDAAGNTSTGTQLVTVSESPAVLPTITAPADVSANTGPGATSCGTFVSDATLGTAIANDNCPGVVVTRTGVPAGNMFPVGNTTVTYTATDRSGNTATDTQIVTVVDNTAPVIACPANITLEPTCPSGAVATWTPPVGTDNCPGATTTRTAGPAPGSVFPIGTTTVTYTVNDAHGNSASCSFTVTVLTPQAVVQNLINAVNALPGLTGQQRQGLLSKLTAALDAINEGKTNVACNKLGDFINQVQSYINNGTLTSALGQPLINSAANVRNTIGCTSLPCT